MWGASLRGPLPSGFRCPSCCHEKGWPHGGKAFTFECAACGKQPPDQVRGSVTAGTILHGSKLPLTVWFWAAYLMATHSNGISALQLQNQLGLGSYTSAWLLCAKLRGRDHGATIKTDGWSAYASAPDVTHDPHVVGKMAAHVVLPWIHRVFSNLKTWALGVYHGLRKPHLQSYLDEFAFRFNRRTSRHAAFRALLDIALGAKPLTYKMLIAPEAMA